MKSKIIIVCLLLVFLIIAEFMHFVFNHQNNRLIYNKISELGAVLSSVDEKLIDEYFSHNIAFKYKKRTIQYPDNKNTILFALRNGYVKFDKTSSYLGKLMPIDKNNTDATIVCWIKHYSKGSLELPMIATFKKAGVFKWELVEIKSDNKIFEYIFFDNSINID